MDTYAYTLTPSFCAHANLSTHFQESMANTDEFVPTLSTSLWIIWVAYALLGGLTVLIYQQAGPVSDNVMEDLRGGEAAQEPLRYLNYPRNDVVHVDQFAPHGIRHTSYPDKYMFIGQCVGSGALPYFAEKNAECKWAEAGWHVDRIYYI